MSLQECGSGGAAAACPRSLPRLAGLLILWKPRLRRHAAHVAERSLLEKHVVGEGSEQGTVHTEFLKVDRDSAWFLTFPDQRGEGWEMLAQEFSGPEVRWRGGWAAVSPGAPRGTSGLGWQHLFGHIRGRSTCRGGGGRRHSHADVMRVRRFSVRQGQVLSLSRRSLGTGPSLRCVFGAGSRYRPFRPPPPEVGPGVLTQSRTGSSSLREKRDAPVSAQGWPWEVNLS